MINQTITAEEARKALGKTGQAMTDDEIEKLVAAMSSLTKHWLGKYEVSVFGKTVDELLT